MENVPSQDSRVVEDTWRSSQRRPQNNHPSFNYESDTPILDETMAIVNEKVWSFRKALKAAAEALVGYGLSPQVVGYATVPVGEDDQLAEKNDGEAALRKVVDDEVLARSSSSDLSTAGKRQGLTGEDRRLVSEEEYEDDTNHAFAEAARKAKDERRSLTSRASSADDHEDDELDPNESMKT